MCKLLLASNHGVVCVGISSLIKDVVEDVDVNIAGSYNEMELMLLQNQYKMLMMGLPVDNSSSLSKIYKLAKQLPNLAILLFCENSHTLPLQRLYKSGVHAIVDKTANVSDFKKAVLQLINNQVDKNLPKAKNNNKLQADVQVLNVQSAANTNCLTGNIAR